MPIYANHGGDSGVSSYEIGDGEITVTFANGATRNYLYTESSAGAQNISQMQQLARAGQGLNAYINQHAKKLFAKKW